MKKKIVLLLTSIFLYSDDIYLLKYNKEANCTALLNNKKIDLYDKRIKKTSMNSPYTCVFIRKEMYNDCRVLDRLNISAQFLSFGSYENTNLLVGYKIPTKNVKAFIKIKCTKNLKIK